MGKGLKYIVYFILLLLLWTSSSDRFSPVSTLEGSVTDCEMFAFPTSSAAFSAPQDMFDTSEAELAGTASQTLLFLRSQRSNSFQLLYSLKEIVYRLMRRTSFLVGNGLRTHSNYFAFFIQGPSCVYYVFALRRLLI